LIDADIAGRKKSFWNFPTTDPEHYNFSQTKYTTEAGYYVTSLIFEEKSQLNQIRAKCNKSVRGCVFLYSVFPDPAYDEYLYKNRSFTYIFT
jgi:hypothetical protein